MIEQAGKLLAEAKRLHDQLEEYYRSAMDFERPTVFAAHCCRNMSIFCPATACNL